MRSDMRRRWRLVLCGFSPASPGYIADFCRVPDLEMLEDGDMTEIGAKGVSQFQLRPAEAYQLCRFH
jgi:hypothetical protein